MAAQQAAISAPGRLPANDGEQYNPPGQSVETKYWCRRSSGVRYSTTEVPFAA